MHIFDCAILLYCKRKWKSLVQYSTVKHVQVNVVHYPVQYSAVKHVEVRAVHCREQYSTVKHVEVNVVHCLV
jgi:hypothetical protein